MWYSVSVKEASVLTVTLSSGDVQRYQPVVSIIGPISPSVTPQELACGLGGSNAAVDPAATASAYVAAGNYLVRIASVMLGNGSLTDSPTLTLKAVLRDVTAPVAPASRFLKKVLGVGRDLHVRRARLDRSRVGHQPGHRPVEVLRERGRQHGVRKPSPNPLIGKYAWRTPGLHRVVLELSDNTGNKSTYIFFVLRPQHRPHRRSG